MLLLLDGLEVVDEHTEHVLDDGLAGRATPAHLAKTRAPDGRLPTTMGWDDHPAIDSSSDLGDGEQSVMPLLIRGVYYEGWDPTGQPHKARHTAEFLAPIWHHFASDLRVEAEQVARAVFTVLAHHVSAGELADISQVLPRELRALWPTTAQA